MTIPAAPPLEDRVASAYRGLSPQERRAADTLLDHLGELGTYRATELAALAGVSKATMSRLFRKLGYEDFEGLRAHLRARRGRGLPIAVGPPPGLRERLEQEVANLEKAYALLDDAVLDEIAAALATAGDVVVVGRRGSSARPRSCGATSCRCAGGCTSRPRRASRWPTTSSASARATSSWWSRCAGTPSAWPRWWSPCWRTACACSCSPTPACATWRAA
nr:hypothetical protein GCM10025730_46970 [Promicromonospora thailandica]